MKNLQILMMIFSVFMLSGCAVELHNIKSTTEIKSVDQLSIVFGRLETAKAWLKTAYVLHIKNITTSKEFSYTMRSWGCPKNNNCNSQPFCLLLPPGEYKIVSLDIMTGMRTSNISPGISFSVKPAATIYIGTLSIGEEITEHNYVLWSNGRINMRILDEHQKDQEALVDSCPGVKNRNYAFSLMSLSENNMRDGKQQTLDADLLPLKNDKNDLGISPDEDYGLIPTKK